jgi:hypothetical protein
MISKFVADFNANRKANIIPGLHLVYDESMSEWQPRTTAKGGLPHLSYIKRKTKPLGTEFKNVADAQTGIMLHLEIQKGKDGMKGAEYVHELGAQSACAVRLGGATALRNIADRDQEEERQETEGNEPTKEGGGEGQQAGTRLCLGGAWFGSVRAAVKHAKLGIQFTGQIKTTHREFPKAACERFLDGKPVGSHCVATATVDGIRLIALGYKCSQKKVNKK